MIEWILVIILTVPPDYDVWGGYTRLDACQRTVAQLETKYAKRGQTIRAECWPVTATFRDQSYQKP